MVTDQAITEAMLALDSEIAQAESALADLRLQRTAAEAFVARLTSSPSSTPSARPKAQRSSTGQTAIVGTVICNAGGPVTVDSIFRTVLSQGHELDREQVRSAITYLRRKGSIEQVGPRGTWQWIFTTAGSASEPPQTSAPGSMYEPGATESPQVGAAQHPAGSGGGLRAVSG